VGQNEAGGETLYATVLSELLQKAFQVLQPTIPSAAFFFCQSIPAYFVLVLKSSLTVNPAAFFWFKRHRRSTTAFSTQGGFYTRQMCFGMCLVLHIQQRDKI
jgi:hypothetical protein